MGLTNFLENKDVKEKFKKEFEKPEFNIKKEILSPPLTENYRLIGTIFHNQINEYISKLNPMATGFNKESFESISKEDEEDIKKLLEIIDPDIFKAKKRCILNPYTILFEGPEEYDLIGNTADIILDDILIEVKVVKNLNLKREYFDQLLGYYTLHRIKKEYTRAEDNPINKLGIYFARHGYLHIIDIKNIINEDTFQEFMAWFIERAEEESGYPLLTTLESEIEGTADYGKCPKCGSELEKGEEETGYMTEGQQIAYEAEEYGTIVCPVCDWSDDFEI
jgi:hypothetical protein